MKQAMINYIKNVKNDELYTPKEAIIPILKYLDKSKIYWECTDFGDSNIRKILVKNGFKVIATKNIKLNIFTIFGGCGLWIVGIKQTPL